MANIDPLAALTAEEMAELLRKRNADKAAMGAAYSGVDEFADIPKKQFTPENFGTDVAAFHREKAGYPSYSEGQATLARQSALSSQEPRVAAFDRFKTGIQTTVPNLFKHNWVRDLERKMDLERDPRFYVGAPDYQWHTPPADLVDRRSFAAEPDVVSEEWQQAGPGFEMPTTPVPDHGGALVPSWDRFRANRPAFFTTEQIEARRLEAERDAPLILRNILDAQFDINEIRKHLPPMPEGTEELENAGTAMDWLRVVIDHPSALAAVAAQSIGQSTMPMAAAIVTGILIPGSTTSILAGMGTAGLTSFLTEAGYALDEVAQKFDIKLSNPDEFQALIENPEKFETFINAAANHARVMAVASSIGAGATLSAIKSALPKAAKLGIGGAAQAASEYGGEKAKGPFATGPEMFKTYVPTTEGAALTEAAAGVGQAGAMVATAELAKAPGARAQDSFVELQGQLRAGEPVTEATNRILLEMEGIARAENPDVVINPEMETRTILDDNGEPMLGADGQPLRAIDRGGLTKDGKTKISLGSIIASTKNPADAKATLKRVMSEEALHAEQEIARRLEAGVRLNIGVDETDKFWNKAETDIVAWLKTKPAYKYILNDLNSETAKGRLDARRLAVDEFVAAVRDGTTPGTLTVRNALASLGKAIGVNLGSKASANLWAAELMKKGGQRQLGAVAPRETTEQKIDELAALQEENAALREYIEAGTEASEAGVLGGTGVKSTTMPQTWRNLEDEDLRTLMEANRAKDNPIWQAQAKELASRASAMEHQYAGGMPPQSAFPLMDEAEAEWGVEGDPDIESYDEGLQYYSGGMEPQSAFPLMDEFEAEWGPGDDTDGVRASVADSTPQEIDVRNINNWWAKRGKNAQWTDEQRKIINDVRKAAGKKALEYRGSQILTLDEFKEIANEVLAGDYTNANKIRTEFEKLLASTKAKKKETQKSKSQEAYALRVGKDRADLAPRRPKGTVSPLEGIMTPVLAKQEIDAQLEAGVIDQATYDNKLTRIEEVQQTVKGTIAKRRALTDAAIGSGDSTITFENLAEQAEIFKRNPNIPITKDSTKTLTKAERKAQLDAAVAKFLEEGGEITEGPKQTDAEIAELQKGAFTHGTAKRTGTWNLTSEVDTFEETQADLTDDFTTTQGETLGDGFEVKSTVLDETKKQPRIKHKGKVIDVIRDYEIKHEDGTTTTMWVIRDGEGNFMAISEDPTLITTEPVKDPARGSAKWKAWISGHEVYGKSPYFKDGKVNVKALAKVYEDVRTAAYFDGVDVNIDVVREYAKNMSPTSVLIGEREALTRGFNKLKGGKGKDRWMDNDHVVELTAPKKQDNYPIRYETGPRDVHHPENYITVDKIMHDAVNHFLRLHPHLKKDANKYTKMITFMQNGSQEAKKFAAHYDKYDLKGYLDKLKNMPDGLTVAQQQLYLLNASESLRGETLTQSKDFEPIYTNNPEALAESMRAASKVLSSVVDPESKMGVTRINADFTSGTTRILLQYLFGAPVKRIADFNKMSAFGVGEQGTITAATVIANAIQRSLSSKARPEGMETGTDIVQETSLRTGEFYSRLFKVFAGVTNNEGIITPEINAQIVDHIAGKPVEFTSPKVEKAAKELKTFMEDMYTYAKDRTSALEKPLDLRGAGDTVLPRVWNIDYIATRRGKSEFLKAIATKFTDPKGKSVFEDAGVTAEDLYNAVVNSGGFVQGEWTNLKADQMTSQKEIDKDLLVQEYLDSLSTEELTEAGLLVDDLQSVIPRFVQKAVERTEYSAVFGTNDEILRSLIQMGVNQIKTHNELVMKMEDGGPTNLIDEKLFQKAVWDMSKILRNKFGYDLADMPTRKWLQRISNVETVAKLPLVTLASLPEFFTPMLKGDVRPDKFAVDFALASAWAGYKGMNGLSKLVFNKHLPAMLKHSSDIGGLGVISDIQLLREMGIADIQSMGDTVATRYANPNFARGGLRAATRGTVGARVPKSVRAVFNMQTYMQATMLTTITEMQQFMALRNYQRHMMSRVKFVNDSKSKRLKGRQVNKLKQYKQDLLDYGVTEDMDLSTPEGEAAFNAGALRFIDQVITRPNDATTAKIFKNPLTAPLVLFKRFITTYGNTLLTSVGTDFATKVDNVERAKQAGKLSVAAAGMYGAVIFAEILRGAIKGDLDEKDFDIKPEDWKTFMRRVDRMGVLSAPGSVAANLTFPSKAWYGDTGTNRMVRELTGPFGSDVAGTLDFLMSKKGEKDLRRLLGQVAPVTRQILPQQKKTKKKRKKKGAAGGLY